MLILLVAERRAKLDLFLAKLPAPLSERKRDSRMESNIAIVTASFIKWKERRSFDLYEVIWAVLLHSAMVSAVFH